MRMKLPRTCVATDSRHDFFSAFLKRTDGSWPLTRSEQFTVNVNKILFISMLSLGLVVISPARPAYSIPTSVDEVSQMFGDLCRDYGLEFCASPPPSADPAQQKREFTETEKQILTRLAEQQDRMRMRETELDRRETQLKALQEDIQRQIAQLETIQQEIERNIETKKAQDNEMLDKAVAFYSKMDAATAAQSIANLDRKVAVNILMRMKDKQASEVLSNMGATQSAELIAEIASKQ